MISFKWRHFKFKIAELNLGEKNIAGFVSQFLLVGFSDAEQAICLITVAPKVPNGQKLH